MSEAVEGQWEIRWSADMAEVQEYNIKEDGEQQEEEGVDSGDPGGIDS